MEIEKLKLEKPDLKNLVDEDILKRFENSNVFYGDIINAQLIKSTKENIQATKELINTLKETHKPVRFTVE